jgi:hypothetical protein
MRRVYIAADPLTASLLSEIIQSKGYFAVVRDEKIFALRGEVGAVYPSVWVHADDYEAARALALEFETQKKNTDAQPPWTCDKCGEVLDPSFEECWKCAEQD